MEEVPFSNREIREMVKDINAALVRIEDQTKRTNGRVSKLEVWRGFLTGGIIVIAAVVIPLVVYAFNVATRCQGSNCEQSITLNK